MAIVVTEQNFNDMLATGKPMMIDFSATWCGPCKALAPIVEELANEYEGRVVIGKADVDECPELSMRFGIRSVPTVIFFKDGKAVDKSIGAVPKNMLVEKINSIL